MDLGLTHKRVLVTGSTRGIGRAIASAFAREGAHVAIGARTLEHVERTVEEIGANGGCAWGQAIDVSNPKSLARWVEAAATALGGIDYVVGVPSGMQMGSDIAAWTKNLGTDILGSTGLIEAAIPHLTRVTAGGHDAAVVLVSSAAAAISYSPSAYGPMKAALTGVAKGYSHALAERRIRVNTISPGMIYFEGGGIYETEQTEPSLLASWRRQIPLRRFGALEEVANAAVFLASPVSAYTTGINLKLDGGISVCVEL